MFKIEQEGVIDRKWEGEKEREWESGDFYHSHLQGITLCLLLCFRKRIERYLRVVSTIDLPRATKHIPKHTTRPTPKPNPNLMAIAIASISTSTST